jgi:hypothetical protein
MHTQIHILLTFLLLLPCYIPVVVISLYLPQRENITCANLTTLLRFRVEYTSINSYMGLGNVPLYFRDSKSACGGPRVHQYLYLKSAVPKAARIGMPRASV